MYPVDKPFSVHDVPRTAADPWEPDIEDIWMGFLERHPEAFDSIDILDDLATAVELHPMSDSFGLRDVLQQPVVDRAVKILLNAVDGSDSREPRALPWLATENRPALRSLARAHAFAESRSDLELARAHAEMLLRLNPADNHGMRAILMNTLLHTGDNVAALSLASRFPDDIFPELPYGRVLAFVRMGRDREASEAAQQAVDAFPEVRRYLMRERAKQPKLSPFGITLGGKDQAWLYREDMRDAWLEEPSAMALLKKTKPKYPQ